MINKLVICMMLCATVLTSCGGASDKHDILKNVMTEQPDVLGASTETEVNGVVKEAHEISASFKVGGQISRIYVREGDHVSKGQTLARLDIVDYDLERKMLQTQYEQQVSELNRKRQLFENNGISGNDYELAVSQVEQLKQRLQLANNKVKYGTLVSPATGYVQAVDYSEKEMVNAGTSVVTIMDMNHLEIECDISRQHYENIKNNSDFTCVLPDGNEYAVQLINIIPKADNNQLFKARFLFPQNPSSVVAGTNVTIKLKNIPLAERAGSIAVPLKAITNKNRKCYLWTVSPDSTVHSHEVVIERIDNKGRAIINGDFDFAQPIVRAGSNTLTEGEKVNIISKPSETNPGSLI